MLMLGCSLMPTDQILALLIAERDQLNRAIEVLQGPTARRSRLIRIRTVVPSTVIEAVTPKRRRRGMSAAARKAQSARMKAFWANRRKQAAPKKVKSR